MSVLRNYTPHIVTVVDNNGNELAKILPEPVPARCAVCSEEIGNVTVAGIPVPISKSVMGKVEGLPEPQSGVFCIVSRIVAEACKDTRGDLLVPDKTVRDQMGTIIGCAGFAVV